MDLDKIKRLIPDMCNRLKGKFLQNEEIQSKETQPESELPKTNYKFLNNTERYFNLHIFEKLWYLRAKFDWFHAIAAQNKSTADYSIGLLEEILKELDRLAYSQATIDKIMEILNLKHNVMGYYIQYTQGINAGEDYFNFEFPNKPNLMPANSFDEIWVNRMLFDDAMATGNKDVLKSVKMWIKNMGTNLTEEEKQAVKNILDKIKQQSKCKNSKHYDMEMN